MSVVFLRFVASSVNATHYPVEVGWAVDGGGVEAHILAPGGDMGEWAFVADVVHALSLDYLLREGLPAAEVAARVLEVLGAPGSVLVSDDPRWEQAWLDRLLTAAGHADHGLVVGDAADVYADEARRLLEVASQEEADAVVADCQRAEVRRRRVRYRAGPDAEGARWVLEEVRRRVGGPPRPGIAAGERKRPQRLRGGQWGGYGDLVVLDRLWVRRGVSGGRVSGG